MITNIRRYFHNSSQIILWIILAAFIVGLMPLTVRQLTQSSIWAIKVNGQEIGYQEFLLERERQKERIFAFKQQYGEYADWLLSLMGASDPQMLAVRELVKQELLNQYADVLGVHMSDEYIAKKMSDPMFVQQELADVVPAQTIDAAGIDPKRLERHLKHFGISADMFERQIERALIDKLVTNILASTVYVPHFDIRQKTLVDHAKKSFSIVKFSLDTFLREEKKKPVSDATLAAFYQEQNTQGKRYLIPEKRSGIVWEFNPKSYNIAVTDAQIEKYYEDNKAKKYVDTPAMVEVRHMLFAVADPAQRAAIQEKATRIKDELVKNPDKFITLAQQVSDDTATAAQGGLLKPFARGVYEPAFDRAAFLLQHDGDISDVIETSRGFEIIQRVRKKAQTFKALAAIKQDIKNSLYENAFQKQFIADGKRVVEHEDALNAFIKEKGGVTKELHEVALDVSPIAQHLFKLSPGQKAFFIEGDRGIIMRLDAVHEKHTPSLASIKSTVLEDYYQQEAQKALKKQLQDAKQAIGSKSLKELQKTLNAEIVQTGWIAPRNKDTIESLKNKGLPIDKMLQIEKIGGVITSQQDGAGFLVRLDEIEALNTKELNEKYDEIAQSLGQERTQQYLDGFVASLYRNATIETNESAITFQG